MRLKIQLGISLLFIFLFNQKTLLGQLTGIKNIPGDYANLALAIADLNTVGVGSGGVTLNLIAGNPQTNPAGGYVIGGAGSLVLTTANALNPIIITGNGNTITAPNPAGTAGALNDAIFKFIGADFVTIQGFVLNENAANTTTAAGTNNMIEWGVAFLYVSTTDGCQNNTIQDNTISLNRNYQNTFGIYSNTRHNSTSISVSAEVTAFTGTNSNNKIYSNAINNVKYGIVFVGSGSLGNPLLMDDGNDIGGLSNSTGNNISNWGAGTTTTTSSFVSVTGSNYCVFTNQQINENVSYNTIVSAALALSSTVGGILKNYSVLTPAATTVTNSKYNNNIVTVTNNPSTTTGGTIVAINSQGITSLLATSTITIENNLVQNCILGGSTGTTPTLQSLINLSLVGTLNIKNNTIQNNSITCTTITTGSLFGIINSGASSVINIQNNSIIGNTNTTATTTGTFIGISNQGGNLNCIANIQNNIISNNTLSNPSTATSNLVGISNSSAATVGTLNITGNQLSGFSGSTTGQMQGIINFAPVVNSIRISNNILGSASADYFTSNIGTNGVLFGIVNASGAATCNLNIDSNIIRKIVFNVASTSSPNLISNQGTANLCKNVSISENVFENLSLNTLSSVFFIGSNRPVPADGSKNINSNRIEGTFNKTQSGGVIQFYTDFALSPGGAIVNNNNNNFSNINVVGTTSITGWVNEDGFDIEDSPVKNFNNNIFNNINAENGNIILADFDFTDTLIASNNVFSNISSNDTMFTFVVFGNSNYSKLDSNLFENLISTGTGGIVGAVSLLSSGNNGAIIDNNTFQNLSSSGPTTVFAAQLLDTVTVSNNKICGVAGSNTNSLAKALMFFDNALVYNNRISSVQTPNADGFNQATGIEISSGESVECYYNTVLMNGTSVAPFFGSSAIFVNDSISLILQNNIFINNCIPTGGGICTAYRRSGSNLSTYNTISNNNNFFGSTLFTDSITNISILGPGVGSLKDFLTPRESNSVSENTTFLSTSCGDSDYLNLDPNYSGQISNTGIAVAGISVDFEGDTRSVSTPDIGADEFEASCILNVTSSLNSGANSLRDILACAVTGSTITIDPSVSTIDLTSSLTMPNKTLTIIDNAMPAAMIKLNSDVSNISLPASSNLTINSINIKDLSATKTNPVLINAGNLDLINVKISGDTGSTTSPTYQNNGTGSVDGNCEIRNE